MKNALKFLGLIALVAVIGFSFVACGEGPQGTDGKDGKDGTDGTPGADGGMIPYIPAESGLLDTFWMVEGSDPLQALTISDDGYTFRRIGTNSGNYQVLSYWKGSDSTVTIMGGSGSAVARLGISGDTVTWGTVTLPKQSSALSTIPAESGLRGTTWIATGWTPIPKITFSGDGLTFTSTSGSYDPTTYSIRAYWKESDGTIKFLSSVLSLYSLAANGNTLTSGSLNYTKEE